MKHYNNTMIAGILVGTAGLMLLVFQVTLCVTAGDWSWIRLSIGRILDRLSLPSPDTGVDGVDVWIDWSLDLPLAPVLIGIGCALVLIGIRLLAEDDDWSRPDTPP
jgi:hypothetical protein